MEAVSYVCPNCGATMEFNSEIQKMQCYHCNTVLSVKELEKIHNEANERYDSHVDGEIHGKDKVYGEFEETGDDSSFKVYRCQGCGAEILTDENTAATFCSFCGRPSLMEDRLTGQKTPAVLIPFKIKKDTAIDIYKQWLKKGPLTPSMLKRESTIEKITGMYVPFWLYDYDAEMNMSAKCTISRRQVRGDYEYIHTDHYLVDRDVETEYLKIPADASEKMPDDIMDKLEPFTYDDIEKFEMPYLSGYYAEKYNYDSKQMAPRVEKRVKQYIYKATRDTIVGYETVNVVTQQASLGRKNAKYALMPVWILNYTYKGLNHMFAINGQTGKVVADRPVSKPKAVGWFSTITAVVFTALFLVGRYLA